MKKPSPPFRLPFMPGCDPDPDADEVLDAEDIDEAAYEAFTSSAPPPLDPEPMATLAQRTLDGDVDALGRVCLDWLLIQGFPEGLDRQDPDHAVIPARDAFPALAQECFRRAIECGCTTGYNGLSWAARDGMGTKGNRQDYALGEEWDREAAERRETLDMVAGALFNENA